MVRRTFPRLLSRLVACAAIFGLVRVAGGCGSDVPAPSRECPPIPEPEVAAAEHKQAVDDARAFRELSAVLEGHAVDAIALSRPDCRIAPCIVRTGTDPCKLLNLPGDIVPFASEVGAVEGASSEWPFFRKNPPPDARIDLNQCLFHSTTPWETRTFISWSVIGAPDFRYMQQLNTTKAHEICGGGCAVFERGKLTVTKYPMQQQARDKPVRETYQWKGGDDGRGRFVLGK
jgi:hypothetical protein